MRTLLTDRPSELFTVPLRAVEQGDGGHPVATTSRPSSRRRRTATTAANSGPSEAVVTAARRGGIAGGGGAHLREIRGGGLKPILPGERK